MYFIRILYFFSSKFFVFYFYTKSYEVYNYTSYIIFLTQEQEGVAKLIEMLSRAGGKK